MSRTDELLNKLNCGPSDSYDRERRLIEKFADLSREFEAAKEQDDAERASDIERWNRFFGND